MLHTDLKASEGTSAFETSLLSKMGTGQIEYRLRRYIPQSDQYDIYSYTGPVVKMVVTTIYGSYICP